MIKTMIKPMRCGKTFEAIKLCSETPQSVIVCISLQEADRVADMAISHDIKIPHPVTLEEALHKMDGSHYIRLILDNVDMMLPMIFRKTITGITLHGNESKGSV
jgi:hypothetical protein